MDFKSTASAITPYGQIIKNFGWQPKQDSNLQHSDSESDVLPVELLGYDVHSGIRTHILLGPGS